MNPLIILLQMYIIHHHLQEPKGYVVYALLYLQLYTIFEVNSEASVFSWVFCFLRKHELLKVDPSKATTRNCFIGSLESMWTNTNFIQGIVG
jgi:hypothetical protein